MSSAVMEAPEVAIEANPAEVVVSGSIAKAYVIQGDLVGTFRKGEVVAEHMFQPGTNFERLILCIPPAMRPAMPHEVPGTIVDASDTIKPGKSITQQLHDANDMVNRLSSKISGLEKELEVVKNSKTAAYDPDRDIKMQTQFDKLKNAVFVLEGQNKAHLATIEDLRKKLNTKR